MDHFAWLVKTDEKAELFRPSTTAKLSSSRGETEAIHGFCNSEYYKTLHQKSIASLS